MSDQDNKPSAGLEALLRRWGADSAMREARVPEAPSPDQAPAVISQEQPGPVGVGPGAAVPAGPADQAPAAPAWARRLAGPKGSVLLVRWMPVAVAAVLLLSSAILFFHSLSTSGAGGKPQQELRQVTADREQIRRDLVDAIGAVELATAELAELKTEQGRSLAGVGDREDLRDQLRRKETQAAKLKKDLAASTKLLEEMGPELKATIAQVKEAEELLAYKDQRLDDLARDVDEKVKRTEAAQAELNRLISANEEAAKASRRAVAEMALMRARREGLFADARRLYLSIKAPDEVDLRASQTAARGDGMLAQCDKFRLLADADALRTLIDKLEVFFTRLEILDAAVYEDVQSFRAAVSSSKIIDGIDDALGSRVDNQQLRTWLFKSRLILMSTGDVG